MKERWWKTKTHGSWASFKHEKIIFSWSILQIFLTRFASETLQRYQTVYLTGLWRGCRVCQPGPGDSVSLLAAGPERCNQCCRWRLSGCRSRPWLPRLDSGGGRRTDRGEKLKLDLDERGMAEELKDTKTHRSLLWFRGVWEVQVERRLRGAKEFVWQVHVDVWTKQHKSKSSLVSASAGIFWGVSGISSPRLGIHSLWTLRSWALFIKDTISFVLVAAALNLLKPPTCFLGFLGAAWANRWSRYWARSSASGREDKKDIWRWDRRNRMEK